MRGGPPSALLPPHVLQNQQKKGGIHQMAGANIASNGQGSLTHSQNNPLANFAASQ